ncbi:site-specific integrase [Caballeronia sp. LZ065]|uniref:site-specific integrase n=1 Tax=Caballeronia sp. LZ065 TaxID=3038571 RepID=UPI0028602874|nr:site-specific integrase [Caballeronia sp. LZ065]MDR5779165.1 site-specific integrase [Caballeronia sp. LZ065]
MCTHLIRRGARYSIRRRVPSDLIAVIGKHELVRALGTADRSEAVRRCRLEGVRIDAEWSALRAGTPQPGLPDLPHTETIVPQPHKQPARTGRSLSEVLAAWAKERQPQPRTVTTVTKVVNRFRQMVGNIPLATIERKHVVAFKNALIESGQTAVNTDKQLVMLRTLLAYAANQGWMSVDPSKGVRVGERRNAKAVRLPFDLPALKRIFSSQVYTEGHRPAGGGGAATYWMPLLALYTGARLEELAQLRPEDVQQSAYVDASGVQQSAWILRISDIGEGQEVKTAASRRRVPIHADLISLGFIEYAQSVRGARLFPLLKMDSDGREGGLFGKWFGKQIRKLGISDRRMVFHSFRHLLKHAMRECGISEEVSDAITGHTSGSVGRRYGATLYPLAPLVDAMQRYRVHGLVLPERWRA